MVRFVVDDQDVLLVAQLFEHPAAEGGVAFHAPLHHTSGAAVILRLEEMPVRDLELALLQPLEHPAGHEVELS
jgi:hypothetical protein